MGTVSAAPVSEEGARLNWAAEEFVRKLNAAMCEERYSVDVFKKLTGRSVDELWAEYKGTV